MSTIENTFIKPFASLAEVAAFTENFLKQAKRDLAAMRPPPGAQLELPASATTTVAAPAGAKLPDRAKKIKDLHGEVERLSQVLTSHKEEAQRLAQAVAPKNHGWTPERRARQAALLRRIQPWKKSTGPKTESGKARSSQNARKTPRQLHRVAKRDLKARCRAVRHVRRQYFVFLRAEIRAYRRLLRLKNVPPLDPVFLKAKLPGPMLTNKPATG